jgi:hypothetical protein
VADWPLIGGGQLYDTYLERTATSDGTPVTVASTNTKGSWITVVDPVPYHVTGLIVNVRQSVAGSPSCLVDLGVSTTGGTTNMNVVVPDLLFSSRLGHPSAQWIPITIPVGVRLNVRCQSTSTTNIPQVTVTLIGGTFAGGPTYSKMLAYGVNTADSGGTEVDPGGTANTKPASYTTIAASTTSAAKWLFIAFAAAADSAKVDCSWLVDIATGAASSEIILIPDILVGAQTASDVITPQLAGPFPVDIPVGTRLSARCQCSTNVDVDRDLDMALYTLG